MSRPSSPPAIARSLLWARAKPILRPVWQGLRAGFAFLRPWFPATLAERIAAEGARRDRARRNQPEPPIRPLRHDEIVRLAASASYYRDRVGYLDAAANAAADLIARYQLTSALELGPNLRPIIVGADIMDITDRPALRTTGRRIIHNATVAPWPPADRSYDLFVALQVFEHLGSGQATAFAEVRRVARHAIVSLPIDWDMDDPRNCHHQLSREKVLGWFAPVVPTRIITGNRGRRTRLIYVFENLPPVHANASPDTSALSDWLGPTTVPA
jgi:hypothetical protein